MCEEATWQLRSMNLKHTCGQSHMVGIMHTSWLSRAFKNKVEHNPKVKIKELGNKAQMKWNLTVTTSMAARSRQAVLDEIQGEYKKQYKRIADYYSELLRANPGSSVTLKIERRGRLAGEWRPCWSAVQTYEVVNRLSKYTVDLSLRERFYKKWKLSGIPCTHTISCINFKGLDMHSYVDDYYKRDAYVKCYDSIINPLNGSDLWEHTNFDDVMSPPYRKPSHRPVKKRKRGPDESEARIQTHLSRRGQIQWCSNCGASGHKRGRCSNPPLPAQPPKQSAVKKTNGGRKRSISKPAVQSAIRGRKRSNPQGKSSSQPQPATNATPITRSKPNTTSAAIPQQRPKMKPIRSSTQPPLAAKKKGTSSSSQPVMNKVSFSHNIALHISPRKLRLMTKLPPRT
ncbi:hypothetical protein Ahy_A03g015696 [Arachis hypogaea]|uniref:CCHC-type domain-containing protein n=1 Tax=Arachis hypogaea TaxID=3818 RepID=A0A445E130_ARAHY|nr:hypothetical protein Ahy_A03g015696 [Arachis hypogaea]